MSSSEILRWKHLPAPRVHLPASKPVSLNSKPTTSFSLRCHAALAWGMCLIFWWSFSLWPSSHCQHSIARFSKLIFFKKVTSLHVSVKLVLLAGLQSHGLDQAALEPTKDPPLSSTRTLGMLHLPGLTMTLEQILAQHQLSQEKPSWHWGRNRKEERIKSRDNMPSTSAHSHVTCATWSKPIRATSLFMEA